MPEFADSKKFIYTLFAGLAAFQAGTAIAAYLDIPGEAADALLFGLSAGRLVLAAVPAAVLLACGLLLALGWWPGEKLKYLSDNFEAFLRDVSKSRRLLFASLALIFIALSLELFTTWEDVLERLQPLLTMTWRLAAIGILFVPLLAYGVTDGLQRIFGWLTEKNRSAIFSAAFVAVILFRAAFSAMVNIGPDVIGWNTTDTPIKDTDLLIALGFIVLVLAVDARRPKNASRTEPPESGRTDHLIFLTIWLVTAVYWAALPLQASWYLAGPMPPNFEYAPASDALVYDLTAQNMLIGETLHTNPFDDVVVRRPLYTFFIGIVRTLVGQDYAAVALVQSMVLAVLPALVYLAARQMSGRIAAAVAALLVMLQGGTSIVLSDVITVSHAKLLMSDVPSALGVAAYLALVFAWVRSPADGGMRRRLLAAGAVLGSLLLIRFETLLLLPATLLFAWLAVKGRIRPLVPGAVLVTAGMLLVIAPWLLRNFAKTGQVYIEVPGNRISFLFNRLLNSPAPPPGETSKVDSRALRQEDVPDPAARIISHFLHSNVQNLLIFPSNFRMGDAVLSLALNREPDRFLASCCSGEEYVRRLPFWQWYKWDLKLTPTVLVPILGNLSLLVAGIVLAWRKARWAGLLPLAYGELHILVNAVARTSGGRYLLPVEWIWISYYAAGLLMAVLWAARLLRPVGVQVLDAVEPRETRPEPAMTLLLPAVGLLALGTLLALGERLYPPVYAEAVPQAWLDSALAASAPAAVDLHGLLDSPGGVVLHGRSMYPRFYAADDGALDRLFPSHYFQPFGRLVFFVTGPVSSGILLPLDVPPDLPIPFGENVVVIGCRVDHPQIPYTEAAAAYFPDSGLILVRSDLQPSPTCPLQPVP